MICTSYNQDYVDDVYEFFSELSKEHSVILDKIETLRKKLKKREPLDLPELKRLLVKHKKFEEKNVYPVLDQEINEGEKRFIIDRINDIIV